MRIAMIGTGYVGLVSGACFSEFGVAVTCVDKDAEKIERLRNGDIPIYEPGLDQLVASNAAAGRLRFTTELKPAVAGADAVFIAVGTPSRRGDGHADLSYVFAAAAEIAEALAASPAQRTVVVTKSTVPVGTGRRGRAHPAQAGCRTASFDVASNPEFLREGTAVADFFNPDRVVVGTREHGRGYEILREALRAAVGRPAGVKFLETSRRARRDDQIRIERISGDQDRVHQRNLRPLRATRRRCPRCRARHRPRSAASAPTPRNPAQVMAARASRRIARR